MKREKKHRAKNGSLRNTSTDRNGTTRDFDKSCKRACQKGRLSPASKARRETSRNEFVEKGGVPDRVESFREINDRQDRVPGLGLLNHPKWTEQGTEFDLKCRPSRAETGLAGRNNGIRLQKED